jgi:tetratricopeptide (TPR) repeat protein
MMLSICVLVVTAAITPEELVTLAEQQVEKGDPKKALVTADRVLADASLTPAQRARALRSKGFALLRTKRVAEARAPLTEATTLAPTDEKAWLYLGLVCDAAEETEEALLAYEKGAAANPKSMNLLHELGMTQLQVGRAKEAADTLAKAVALATADGELLVDAAYAHVIAGKPKEGLALAERARELLPESANVDYTVGLAKAALKDTAGAKAAYLRALDNDDAHVGALLALGLMAQRKNDDDEAAKRLLQVLRLDPDNDKAKAALGLTLVRAQKDDARAEALLTDIVKVDPGFASGHAALAELYERQGKHAEAIAALERAVKAKPDPAWQKQLQAWKRSTPKNKK